MRSYPESLNELKDLEGAMIDTRHRFEQFAESGMEDYVPYDEASWNRAVTFVMRGGSRLWKQHGIRVEPPELFPTTGGGIDIEWESDGDDLLIHVPPDEAESATYYGKDGAGHVIKESLDLSA